MKPLAAVFACASPYLVAAQGVFNTPDAPDLAVSWDPSSMEFTFVLTNPPGSNNYNQNYTEYINPPVPTPDQYWRFQGYVVFQFRDPADADDSLHLVLKDPARVRPVILVDKADTITSMLDNLHTTAPDTCTLVPFVLDNAGLGGPYTNSFDPFTTFGYDPHGTYCFMAVAFAFNRFHRSATCDTVQQVLYSKHASTGALQGQCVDIAHIGIAEHGSQAITLSPVPASNVITFTGAPGMQYRIRCMSATGALVFEDAVSTGASIDMQGWAPGLYHVLVVDAVGNSFSRRIVVER